MLKPSILAPEIIEEVLQREGLSAINLAAFDDTQDITTDALINAAYVTDEIMAAIKNAL